MMRFFIFAFSLFLFVSCGSNVNELESSSCDYALYFDLLKDGKGISVLSPYDGRRDTLMIDKPLDNIICMSSSHVACLSAIHADSVISAVSGMRYISYVSLRSRTDVYDIGYEPDLDYERILKINPDILVTYTVSGAEPQYISKLRSLGVTVLVLHDHLENHPLARAEYLRLFGVLTGHQQYADSLFNEIAEKYETLRYDRDGDPLKVLMNIPYGDAWYIPGADSYLAALVRDAGGEILGAEKGTSSSRTISIEQAYGLSLQSDIWLNPGHCGTREDLASVHALFPRFGPLKDGLPIYNNTLRTTPEGGNDFWESGAVRPDLVLEDLKRIFSGQCPDSLNYFIAIH